MNMDSDLNFRVLFPTLELGWSANSLLHQFGLPNRTNQVSAPRYVIM